MGELQGEQGGVNRGDALQLLNLNPAHPTPSASTVRAAWARMIRVYHPDTSEHDSHMLDPPLAIQQLTEARDLLLDVSAGADRACKFCHGTGRVRGRLGAQDCTMCRGTGDKQP